MLVASGARFGEPDDGTGSIVGKEVGICTVEEGAAPLNALVPLDADGVENDLGHEAPVALFESSGVHVHQGIGIFGDGLADAVAHGPNLSSSPSVLPDSPPRKATSSEEQ
ncbi:hypothetical protein FM101_03595 [Arthrobacter rhombi]|uniref:Uncharacterized protein n=1 Tax=Arthrobacter rhombi TaxID=71253 RepID=A0A1R4FEP4_9MICC|nr:hypothetical protein FM101_03595 [Arthrobacter rhombi]